MKSRLFFLFLLLTGCMEKKSNSALDTNSSHEYATPYFADTASFSRLQATFPVIEKLYREYAEENHFPAISFGVVANGQLVYTGSVGVANVASKTAATPKTMFRIASMSKSFTAMAILKLRDEGRLSLSDAVEKYIPEMKKAGVLTSDAPPITVQHLLTMSAGFPEDNPWGDRQLDASDEELLQLLSKGLSFSNAPGLTFEYSNLGFALLGKIISNISGVPYQQYITNTIMKPIGMNDSKWEYTEVSADQLALGYQWMDSTWQEVPLLHDGAYGAMGGLICSVEDFAKYMVLHMQAWPPRNEAEAGPVRRSSIREMHQPWRFNNLFADAKTRRGEYCPVAIGYGYGLGWRKDCKGTVRISHSGGLPGFGSEWRFYPEYGVGVVSFSNHTYGAPGMPNAVALDTLISIAGLKPRVLPASAILQQRQKEIVKLLPEWSVDQVGIFAENFFLDESLERRKETMLKLFEEAGTILNSRALEPENQLRGSFILEGEKKNILIYFTLTPEREALIQQLDVQLLEK